MATEQEHGPRGAIPAASSRVTVTVLGFDGSPLGPAARHALQRATLVIGSIRHLDLLPVPETARRIYMGGLGAALTRLALHDGPAVVVASGDPGYFGVVRALREQGLRVRTIPAVSSVATAFGRIGLAWEDAFVVAVDPPADGVDSTETRGSGKVRTGGRAAKDGGFGHGPGATLRAAANLCRAYPKVAVMCGEGAGPRELAVELLGPDKSGPARTLVVAQRLGEPEESVEWLGLDEAAERHIWGDPCIVLCLDEAQVLAPGASGAGPVPVAGWAGPAGGWAATDNAFVYRSGRVLPAEARALVLARLAPRPGTLVWDVGAGSGSVGIECARLGAAVVAVERDADSCERIDLNATMHQVRLRVVRGQAPEALLDLPQPDAVFLGGGGPDVVRAVTGRDPRIVVAATTAIDRVAEVKAALRGEGRERRRVDGVLLQSSRLVSLPGDAHRFAAQDPVFVLWSERS
ncbi:precorrin-6y C5,15-methyltransferase (decarboxylating) subunit CbiE [Actinospica sp.]|uniref:precorrin-6y C5,15-methyltransferase (decarboxylating) subunit CbiE n=1 Tax=Actinospica sp. TaxID=1872142 RepID=UPI002C0490A5|nr:precorrin-6y C5,15-methyltransferase (decarboxylating) subunit CbiE [Actinospica sp.]HWG27690.1 precorrin-6y C5,15-methyltransferase (decarboxylating) subunit CbiE [Actinospica sp.]